MRGTRGVVGLAIAMSILLFTAVFAFWRVSVDEKAYRVNGSSDLAGCVDACAEGKP